MVDAKIDSSYNSLVKVTIYCSLWLLSVIVLYTYNIKRTSKIEYNKIVTNMNTKKLTELMKVYKDKSTRYYELAFPAEVMNTDHEVEMTGIVEAKREMYESLIKVIEQYDKCNYIRYDPKDSPYPYTEVMVTLILLAIVVGVIIITNIRTNPFKQLRTSAVDYTRLNNLREKITNLNNSTVIQSGGAGPDVAAATNVAGPMSNTNFLSEAQLNKAKFEISSQLNLYKSDMTFNYIVVSVSILIMTLYVSFKLFKNASKFTNNLYSGHMFMTSRCYDDE